MEPTPSVPLKATWKGSLSHGWETMKRHFLHLLLITIVCGIVQMPLQVFHKGGLGDVSPLKIFIEFLALGYWLLFVPVIVYSTNFLFIQAVRNEALDLQNIIIGFKNYLNIVLVHLFVTALIGIALIALIVPGIIVACRLVFVSYLVMDKDLGPIEAVETSWRMTKGHGWRIFLLGLTMIPILIGGFVLCVVGLLPATIWINASFASLYQAVLNEQGRGGTSQDQGVISPTEKTQ